MSPQYQITGTIERFLCWNCFLYHLLLICFPDKSFYSLKISVMHVHTQCLDVENFKCLISMLIFSLYTYLWWVWPWLCTRGLHPAALSLQLFNRAGRENKMQKLRGWDKDRDITHQLPSCTKQLQLRED